MNIDQARAAGIRYNLLSAMNALEYAKSNMPGVGSFMDVKSNIEEYKWGTAKCARNHVTAALKHVSEALAAVAEGEPEQPSEDSGARPGGCRGLTS